MMQTTILEKLKIIYEISKNSKSLIAVIAFIILLAIVALSTNKHNAKRGKKIYAMVYTIILITMLVLYHDSLGKMFDYMMNNLFIVLYFPNAAVYLAAIIITNIILLVSAFNHRTSKIVKVINVIMYGIIHYLLALVLNVINNNNLDVFSQTSVYSNKNAQAIIELSSVIFIIWIIFLILYKIINKYLVKDVVPVKKKVVVKKVRALPDSIAEVPVPRFVKAQPKKIVEEPKSMSDEPIIIAQLTDQHLFEKEELEKQLEEMKQQLKVAEEQIKIQEQTIKIKDEQRIKLEAERHELEQEQIELQYQQTKMQQETTRLQHENQKLQTIKLKTESNENTQKVDATTAIMKNLDGMLTLEDYKVLATLLKDKQKRKNAETYNETPMKKEQLNFTQLFETSKSVR